MGKNKVSLVKRAQLATKIIKMLKPELPEDGYLGWNIRDIIEMAASEANHIL